MHVYIHGCSIYTQTHARTHRRARTDTNTHICIALVDTRKSKEKIYIYMR